ncbi:MAG: hypothetical protein ACJ757_00320 [Gaiellaceae bacterium]
MRKLTFGAVLLVALVATSYAVANGIRGAKSAKAVAGTFAAAGTSASTRTCTTTDGKTVVVTDGKYTGAAVGGLNPELTGPITVRARSVINTTDGVGTVTGRLTIDATGKNTEASYTAVYDHGTVAGLAVGKAHEPNAKLIANLSATFSATTGFTGGKLGGGTAAGTAVELAAGGCNPSGSSAQKSEARGTITALSTTSITVANVTCVIPSEQSADVTAKYHTGDSVKIECTVAGGTSTLTKIQKTH